MKLSNRCHCAVLLLAGTFNQGIVPPAKVTGLCEVGQHQDWYFEAVAGSECTLRLKGLAPGFSAQLDVFDLQSGVPLSDAGWTKASSQSAVSTGTLVLESSGRFGVRVTGLDGVGSYAVSHRLVHPKSKQTAALLPVAGSTSSLQLDLHALAGWRLDLRLKFLLGLGDVTGLTLLHPSGLEEDLLRSCKLKLSESKGDVLTLHAHPLPESGTYSLLVHGDLTAIEPPQVELTRWLRASKSPTSTVTADSYETVLYVDDDARGNGDGADWPDAFPDLQPALVRARQLLLDPLLGQAPAGPTSIELRIAGGTYRPDGGTLDRTLTFDVPRGVALRGGYAGLAGSGGDERDIAAFPTMLSGDLLGDDTAGFQFREDNAISVVVSTGNLGGNVKAQGSASPVKDAVQTGLTVILDGLTVLGAHWTPLDVNPRGALVVDQPRVVLRDCDVRDNSGSTVQSYIIPGVVRLRGVIVLVDTRISNNRVELQTVAGVSSAGVLIGGAARVDASDDVVSLMKHCEITGNAVEVDTGIEVAMSLPGFQVHGAALQATGTLQIVDCTIAENHTSVLATKPHPVGLVEIHGVGALANGRISLVDCDIRENSLDVMVEVPAVTGSGIGLGAYLSDFGLEGGGWIQGCRITANRLQATNGAGGPGMSGGGVSGIFPHLVDTLVAGNVAPRFAGVERQAWFPPEDSEILGCTIVGNTSTAGLGANFLAGGRVANSLLAGNLSLDPPGPAVDLVMGFDGPVVFEHSFVGADLSALVEDPLGPDGLVGTGDETWLPLPGSPLIDAGWAGSYEGLFNLLGIPAVAGRPLRDAAGVARFQTSTPRSSEAMPDVGAFEAPP